MRARRFSVVAFTVAVLAACTGGDPAPTPTGAATSTKDSSSGSDAWTVEKLAEVTLEGELQDGSVLGEAEGALYQLVGGDVSAQIAVTEIVADDGGTIVRFTLRSADGSDQRVTNYAFNRRAPGIQDIRDVAIVDPVAQSRLKPFLGTKDPAKPLVMCTCSNHPYKIGDAADELTATFPPLDPSTTEVTVEVPGFPALEGLPVTRA